MCWGETQHPRLVHSFALAPIFARTECGKNSSFVRRRTCATQAKSHMALLENLCQCFFKIGVFSHLQVWDTVFFVFFAFFFSLVDLPQNLHRGLLGLSVGCRGSIDSRLLFERQMKCWICLIHKQINVCYHSGEEKGKRRQRAEEWRKVDARYPKFSTFPSVTYAAHNSLLVLPSRTLHEILFFQFRHSLYIQLSTFISITHADTKLLSLHARCARLSTFISVTHATRNFVTHATLRG